MLIKAYGNNIQPYQMFAFKNSVAKIHNSGLFSQFKTYDEFKKTTVENKTKDKKNIKAPIILAISFIMGGIAALVAHKKIKPKAIDNSLQIIKENYQKTIQNFPKDKKYYQTLAQAINLSPNEEFKLNSIVGEEQLKHLLKTYTPIDFQVGKNFEGVKNLTYRVNLHNHTQASDGVLSVEEILEQAVSWANRIAKNKKDNKPPFLLALTDHDTLDGAKEAVKIIANNPEKYKNLKVVLGSEISVSHINPEHVIYPVDFELLGYCLNPFNQKLDTLLKNLQKSREESARNLIVEFSKKFGGYNLSLSEAKKFHANLEKARTNGILNLVGDYIEFKIRLSDYVKKINERLNIPQDKKLDIEKLYSELARKYYLNMDATQESDMAEFLKNKGLKPILQKINILNKNNSTIYASIFDSDYSYQRRIINELIKSGLPTINDTKNYCLLPKQIFETVENEDGFFGFAHPGLIKLKSPYGNNISQARKEKLGSDDPNKNLVFEIFYELKKLGKEKFLASETNYQSYRNLSSDWIEFMKKDIADNPLLKLYYTGGLDCHSPSIFSNHDYVFDDFIKAYELKEILGKKHEDFASMFKEFEQQKTN